jgi:exonuclease SbcD
MSDTVLRFLQAGDFRLDTPMSGLPEIPEQLLGLLIDAPFQAAERVFDAAIRERADLLLLTGELLDLQSPTPRSLAFLHDQFQRLKQSGVRVLWAPNAADSAHRWPSTFPLPDHVTCFDSSDVERAVIELPNGFTVSVLGRMGVAGQPVRLSEFLGSDDHLMSLALCVGSLDSQKAIDHSIDFWAVGGQANRDTPVQQPHMVHFAGTPQGREPRQRGPHGCTVVEVTATGSPRLRFIECDAVQWQQGRVVVAAVEPRKDIHESLARHVDRLQSAAGGKPLLVHWEVFVQNPPSQATGLRDLAEHLTEWLQSEYGHGSDPVWTVSVDVTRDEQLLPSWYEEDTLLGDYLRAIEELRTNESAALNSLLDQHLEISSAMRSFSDSSDPEIRSKVVQEAGELGAKRLRGMS